MGKWVNFSSLKENMVQKVTLPSFELAISLKMGARYGRKFAGLVGPIIFKLLYLFLMKSENIVTRNKRSYNDILL